jgi:hypothetical protein
MEREERRQQHPLRQIAGGAEQQQGVRSRCHCVSINPAKTEPLDGANDTGSDRNSPSELNYGCVLEDYGNNALRRNSLPSSGIPPVSGMNARTAMNPVPASPARLRNAGTRPK